MTIETATERAQEILLARALAARGANVSTVTALTRHSQSYAKKIVRESDGEGAGRRKRRDSAMWFEGDLSRLIHAAEFIKIHRLTDASLRPAERMLNAFDGYCWASNDPLLNINDCLELIELYDTEQVSLARCATCETEYLQCIELSKCPVCRRLEKMRCRTSGCENLLPDGPRKRGRPREYCSECEAAGRNRRKKPVAGALVYQLAG